ncbi:hypothetical protein GCM10028791_04710 [Echinicola sediminis]
MLLENRNCLYCERVIQGRSDKKFCDDQCRNSYNNQLKAGRNNLIRNINNALKKNHKILEAALSTMGDTVKVSREKLLIQGFQFKYQTHKYINKKGDTYIYCYDYGYLELESDLFLIVRERGEA